MVGTTPLAFADGIPDKLLELSILYGTNDQPIKDRRRQQSAMAVEDGSDSSHCNRTIEEAKPQSKTGTIRVEPALANEHRRH